MDSELQENLRSQLWRLNNLYQITDKAGRRITFTMNSAQEELFYQMHRQNVILKARQRGLRPSAFRLPPSAFALRATADTSLVELRRTSRLQSALRADDVRCSG
jgi:hypothetical protein